MKSLTLLKSKGYKADDLPNDMPIELKKSIALLSEYELDIEDESDKETLKTLKAKAKSLDTKLYTLLVEWIEEDDEEDDDEDDEVFSTGLKPKDTYDSAYIYDYCVKLIKHVENAFISVNELIGVQVKLSILEKNKLINLKDIVLFQHKEKGKLIGFYVMYRADYDKEFLPKKK